MRRLAAGYISDLADAFDSCQLGGREASSPLLLPRVAPSCTFDEPRHGPYGCGKAITLTWRPIEARGSSLHSQIRLTSESQAPEVQTMYNMPMPVSTIRTRMRQEFERHRFANKLSVVDVLLFKSHAEYQVRTIPTARSGLRMMRGVAFANPTIAGDHELLEADQPRHVLLQGGELPR